MSNQPAAEQQSLPPPRFGALWHHADFLKLWTGETISLFGSQITMLALPLTAVIVLRATSVQVGFLNAAGYAPFLFITLVAGVWIDHHRRRPVLLVSNVGRAVLLSLIPLLALVGQLRIEELYVIAGLSGCFTVFFYLAFQAFLPTLLPQKYLVEGNSKFSATQSLAEFCGPGLAGLLIQLLTAPLAILADAFSFFIAAMSLMLIRTSEPLSESSISLRNAWREISEGLRVIFRERYLWAFAGEAATYNLFWQIMLTIFFLYAVRDLHLTAGILGLLFAVGSAGALLGSLLTGSVARRVGVGLTIIGAAALSDAPPLVLALITQSTPHGLVILLGAFFLQGIGITGCNVHVDSLRQAIIPLHLQGRANAAYRLLVSGAAPLGALLGGWLGAWIGLRPTLAVGGAGLLFTWLWVVLSPVRGLRTFPVEEHELSQKHTADC